MCGKKELFMELAERVHGSVSLGDSSKLPVEDRRKIKIYQKDDKPEYIFDVYYIPSMKSNILSIGQLLEKVYMENNHLWLKNTKGGLIACVKMTRNRMFSLHLNTKVEKYFQGLMKNEPWRWHLRFGHLNFSGLKLLSTAGMVRDLPTIDPLSHTCEVCIIGK